MNNPVSPHIGRGAPPAAALSSARRVVVPMTHHPPATRLSARNRVTRRCGDLYPFAMQRMRFDRLAPNRGECPRTDVPG